LQVNLLNITSWCEILVTYHSDIVTIGYEILTNRIIYLADRFLNILTEKVHIFSNILGFDKDSTLYTAVNKYCDRGFKTERLCDYEPHNMYELIHDLYEHNGLFSSDYREISIELNGFSLFYTIYQKYKDANKYSTNTDDNTVLFHNLAYATSVHDLFDKYEYYPPIKYLSITQIDKNDKNISLVKEFLYKQTEL
jgi:hypothetical protein